jgi:hypothetical protein
MIHFGILLKCNDNVLEMNGGKNNFFICIVTVKEVRKKQ